MARKQFYFLVQLTAPNSYVQVETDDPEFSQIRWIEPANFRVEWVPEFKQQVYRQIFLIFLEFSWPEADRLFSVRR